MEAVGAGSVVKAPDGMLSKGRVALGCQVGYSGGLHHLWLRSVVGKGVQTRV